MTDTISTTGRNAARPTNRAKRTSLTDAAGLALDGSESTSVACLLMQDVVAAGDVGCIGQGRVVRGEGGAGVTGLVRIRIVSGGDVSLTCTSVAAVIDLLAGVTSGMMTIVAALD